MHLCVVSPFPPGFSGLGQYGWHLTHSLARTGRFSRITVLTNRAAAGVTAPSENGTLHVQPVWGRDDLQAGPRLLRAIHDLRPDGLWFNLGFSVFGASRPANFLGLAVPALARLAGRPSVVTLHELFEATPPRSVGAPNGRITALGARAATRLLLRSDMLCVTLQRYADHLRSAYGARNVHHIPHGAFAPPEALPRQPGPPAILMLAGFAPHRGLPVLLAAWQAARRQRPDLRLLLAGSDHHRFPGYLAAVRARTGDSPGLEWHVHPTETQLRGLFGRAGVVVLPYLATTGASSVVHRAAAWGRPLVASDLPDLRAVAEEEGLWMDYTPPGEAGGLAQVILKLIGDPRRQDSLARHNLERMQTMTLEETGRRYADILHRVAGLP